MTIKHKTTWTLVHAFLFAAALAAPAAAGSIQITDAEAELEHNGTAADVFLNISNTGAAGDRLYAAKTPVAARAVLSSLGENEERQVEVQGKEIPRALAYEVKPGAQFRLHEDGPHISLRDLKKTLGVGETFTLTLFFEMAGPVKVEVTVEDH